MKKRIVPLFLALCMLASFCVSAFAADARVTEITPDEITIHRGDVIQLAAVTSPVGNTNVDWWVQDNSIISVGSVDRFDEFYPVNPDRNGYSTDSNGRYYYYDASGNKVYLDNYDNYYNDDFYGDYLNYNYYAKDGSGYWYYIDFDGTRIDDKRPPSDYDTSGDYVRANGHYYPYDYYHRYNDYYGSGYGYVPGFYYYHKESGSGWCFVDGNQQHASVTMPDDLYSNNYIEVGDRFYERGHGNGNNNYYDDYYYSDYYNSALYRRNRDVITIRGESIGTTQITAAINGSSGATCTINVVDEDAYIDGSYYVVNMQVSGGNGTISPKGKIYVKQGARQTFTAIPESGYTLDRVVVDGTRDIPIDGNKFSLTVNEPCRVQVTFKRGSSTDTSSDPGNHSTDDIRVEAVAPVTPPVVTPPVTPPTKNPDTGDSTPISLAAVLLLAGGVLLTVSKKTRK